MEKIISTIKGEARRYGMVIALIIIIGFFQTLTGGILLKPINVTNLILQNSYILILAIGMLLCILTGGNIDLSVGSTAAFIGAVSATFIISFNLPVLITIVGCLIIGGLIGAWQGYWISYVKIPAFIVTLSGMLLFRGLTMVILKGRTLAPFPESYQRISSGFLPDFFGGSSLHITTLIVGVLLTIVFILFVLKDKKDREKHNLSAPSIFSITIKIATGTVAINLLSFWLARYNGIPNVMILLLILIIAYSFITTNTIPGRHIYAMGGNEKAAHLSGVKTKQVLFWVYVNMGVLAALAGIVFAGRLNAATPKAGTLFELDAIAACYIGGASATGGVGTVIGAVIGGLIMGVLNNGMSIMGVSIDWQQAIKGLVLLFAVAFDLYSKQKSKA